MRKIFGDIHYVNNLKFKDNGNVDPTIYGHPMIVVAEKEEWKYMLMCTSDINFVKKNPKQFYEIQEVDAYGNAVSTLGLKKKTWANLKYIYKNKNHGTEYLRYLDDCNLESLCNRLINGIDIIENNNEDIDKEIIDLIKNNAMEYTRLYHTM